MSDMTIQELERRVAQIYEPIEEMLEEGVEYERQAQIFGLAFNQMDDLLSIAIQMLKDKANEPNNS